MIRIFLFNWHEKYKRDFPWRHTKDPYKIMIAEFMLHRTKAEQITQIYSDFLEEYPNIDSLAIAKHSQIEKVTEHLGLHWRTKHFIKSANFIKKEFNGTYPKDKNQLMKIPGVGDYTASVILTVCFNKSVPVIDSNISRFINRYYNLGLKGEIRRKKQIFEKAIILFNMDNPKDFLFAILDFTALVCTPIKPKCKDCVINKKCKYPIEK